MKIKEVVSITAGKPINLVNPEEKIVKFVIDSRKSGKGTFFVPLKGSNVDGHDYIQDAVNKGAVGYFSSKETSFRNGIYVNNTLEALTEVGKYKRKYLRKAIGVTGTSGKTTTKEIISFLLSQQFRVYATEGNYNNEIGHPLTLANIPENTENGIFELGASKKGDIKRLINISQPEIRVLTSVGYGHVEGFGSFEGVIEGKGEIFEDGEISILPDKLFNYYRKKLSKFILFGSSEEADIKISDVKVTTSGTEGRIKYKSDEIYLRIPVYNEAVFYNIAAASAVLYAVDINPIENLKILENFLLPEGRGKVLKKGNITIIDDSYNANPLSVTNAVRTLNKIPGYRVLILGDMLELGKYSKKLHRDIGEKILETDIDLVLLYGKEMRYTFEVIKDRKVSYYFEDKHSLFLKLMEKIMDKETVLLVKGSRGMRMEEIIQKVLQS